MLKQRRNIPNIFLASTVVVLVLLLVAAAVASYIAISHWHIVSASATATAEAVVLLDEAHGSEVKNTIENLESKWFAFAAYKDPSVQANLATSRYLRDSGSAVRPADLLGESSWLVTKSASVMTVRVLEFTVNRFKALARVQRAVDSVSPQGEVLESLPLQYYCSVYVFVWEDEKWKIAAYFNATQTRYVERDWRDASDWLRQIIGDLPEETISYCDELR